MIYLLDTNAAIALLKEQPHMLNHVLRVGRSTLRVCAPVEAELWFGVAKSARQEQNRARLLTLLEWLPSLPFAGQATQHFGHIRAHLASQGTPIGPYDLQIAAIAPCPRSDRCHSYPIPTRLVFACIPCAVWHRRAMRGRTGSVTLAARFSLSRVRQRGLLLAQGREA